MVAHIGQTVGRGKQTLCSNRSSLHQGRADIPATPRLRPRPLRIGARLRIHRIFSSLGAHWVRRNMAGTLSQTDAALAKRPLSLPSFTSGSVFHLSKVSSMPEAAQHAVLCAAGFSLRWLLRANVRGRIKPNSSACFLWRLSAIRAISAMPTSPGAHNCSEPTHRMPALPRTRAEFAVI